MLANNHKTRILVLYEDRIEHLLTRIYEVFLFTVYIKFVKDEVFKRFLINHIRFCWDIIFYAMEVEQKTSEVFWKEFEEYYKDHSVLTTQLPSFIKSYIHGKAGIYSNYLVEGYKITKKDLEEVLTFAEYLAIRISSDCFSHKLDKRDYFFEIMGKELKEGIARKSGNGSVVTLPNSWLHKKVISILTK